MIADIINDAFKDQPEHVFRQLFEVPIICGCLFRSFDDFTQHLILHMYANGGEIHKKEFLSKMQRSPHYAEGQAQFTTAMSNLTSIKIVNRPHSESSRYTLNESFQTRLAQQIMVIPRQFGELHNLNKSQQFNLLLLLRQNNQILKQCNIGSMNREKNMTKQNFQFIRRPIGYKISILIKGYLKLKKVQKKDKERKAFLKNILYLSTTMDFNKKYKITSENIAFIRELREIRLVYEVDPEYFIISPFLHNFAFQGKKDTKLLECSIIIETNFKVYIQIAKEAKKFNYQLIRDIMQNLIKIDHEGYEFQELILGEIDRDKMMQLFKNQNITAQQYLSFFLQYMAADLNIQKDLGKWNKIKFLGLEGPQGQMMIPNNVKQELKLWQTISHKGKGYYDENAYQFDEYDFN